MKMFVKISVNFHQSNACALSIPFFFFCGEESEVLIELRYSPRQE